MGSGTGAKWVAMIALYFTVMLFIVGLVNTTMGTSIGEEVDTSGTYCGSPREIYEPYNPNPIDQSELGWIYRNYYEAHIDCEKSQGILGQDICEDIDGCTWDSPNNWFQNLFGSADDTCTGQMNHTFILVDGTQPIGLLGTGIADYTDASGETSKFICTHPDVYENETLCNELSCTWKYRDAISDFETSDIEPKLSLLGSIWEVTKDLVSFKFDFGFEDTSANFILNFLIFYLPLILLGLAIYVMVRA